MTFSKRERIILIATLVVLGALALDWFALTPLLERIDEVETQRNLLLNRMTKAETVLNRRRVLAPRWRRMVAGSLKNDPGEAESQVLHAIGAWAERAGLNLTSVRPDRSAEETPLPEIDFRAAGTGSMSAVSRFLHGMQTGDIPVRVKNLQLSSRKEGTDSLSLQVTFSTLYVPPDPASASGGNGAAASAGGQP
jgi:Tfp pilus assembly protein PilO